jgi:hypothetical protein
MPRKSNPALKRFRRGHDRFNRLIGECTTRWAFIDAKLFRDLRSMPSGPRNTQRDRLLQDTRIEAAISLGRRVAKGCGKAPTGNDHKQCAGNTPPDR